jgi:hypothetical protein
LRRSSGNSSRYSFADVAFDCMMTLRSAWLLWRTWRD